MIVIKSLYGQGICFTRNFERVIAKSKGTSSAEIVQFGLLEHIATVPTDQNQVLIWSLLYL